MFRKSHELRKTLALTVAIIGAHSVNSALAHGHGDGDPKLGFKTENISGSVYMLSGVGGFTGGFTGGNIGLSIGEDGVAMIDNGLPSVIDLLKAEIAKTTDKPIDYLINTHVHGDHIGNNSAYGAGDTQIVSHDNLRKSLKQKGISLGDGKTISAPKAHLPVITFSDQMTIHLNGDAAQITHFANAHTDGDAVIKFKKANVIHTGDILFNGMFPFIDTSNGGSYLGVKAALQGIYDLANEDTIIIPGHGPIAKKTDIASTIEMLNDTYEAVKTLKDKGMGEQEIIDAKPLDDYSSYHWGFITTEKMIKQLLEAL